MVKASSFAIIGDPNKPETWDIVNLSESDLTKIGDTYLVHRYDGTLIMEPAESYMQCRKKLLKELQDRRYAIGKVMEKWYQKKG